MNLTCNLNLAANFKSDSQRARILSEDWFARNVYCLACDADSVEQTSANTKATDFICRRCSHRYELKTFHRRPVNSIMDGAYRTMMESVTSGNAPTLCLLERTEDWRIHSLTAIHSSFLVPECIEERPPLALTARRAGYVGCRIRLDRMASDGEISVIKSGIVLPSREVRNNFQRFLPLADKSVTQRGWTLLTLRMVRALNRNSFNSTDIYALEGEFAKVYPNNQHIRDKIRQQLQELRDLGILEFGKRGEYRLLK